MVGNRSVEWGALTFSVNAWHVMVLNVDYRVIQQSVKYPVDINVWNGLILSRIRSYCKLRICLDIFHVIIVQKSIQLIANSRSLNSVSPGSCFTTLVELSKWVFVATYFREWHQHLDFMAHVVLEIRLQIGHYKHSIHEFTTSRKLI